MVRAATIRSRSSMGVGFMHENIAQTFIRINKYLKRSKGKHALVTSIILLVRLGGLPVSTGLQTGGKGK